MTNNPCTKCGKPGIPGLIDGAGKCQYHWNEGVWGKAWADAALRTHAPIYVVMDENTLGYMAGPRTMGVLAGNRDGHSWVNGPVTTTGSKLRLATTADFERFRVSIPPDFKPDPVNEFYIDRANGAHAAKAP